MLFISTKVGDNSPVSDNVLRQGSAHTLRLGDVAMSKEHGLEEAPEPNRIEDTFDYALPR